MGIFDKILILPLDSKILGKVEELEKSYPCIGPYEC